MGSATRIYKNSDSTVIAIDDLSISYDSHWLADRRVHNAVKMVSARTLLYLGVGDRVVAQIQMIGDFLSLTEDSGNYLTATWKTNSTAEANAIGFGTLAKLGDTVE